MFICLKLHTNIIKIVYFILWNDILWDIIYYNWYIVFYDIKISGDAFPRKIHANYENIWKIYLRVIAVQYTSGGIPQIFLSSNWYHAPKITFSFYYFTAVLPRPNYSSLKCNTGVKHLELIIWNCKKMLHELT